MKEISELELPQDCRYTQDHEWVRISGDTMKVGINDYAQDQLGEIVFVDLPEPGASFGQGEEFGTVESVKAVSELYMPVAGEVVQVNPDLEDGPELVNSSPYDKGWMVEIRAAEPDRIQTLMDAGAYRKFLEGME